MVKYKVVKTVGAFELLEDANKATPSCVIRVHNHNDLAPACVVLHQSSGFYSSELAHRVFDTLTSTWKELTS